MVKDLGFARSKIEHTKNIFTNFSEFTLDLLSVGLDHLHASSPFDSAFFSIEETIRHEAHLAPITFLYATERYFLLHIKT
jgi:hypothetical protein